MPRSEPQYALYEIASPSKHNEHGVLTTTLTAVSLPLPSWLSGNAVLSGHGIFVIYYTVSFCDSNVSSALFQNEFEIPATREYGNENYGSVILSICGTAAHAITLRATSDSVLSGNILIAKLSFHDEDSVIK